MPSHCRRSSAQDAPGIESRIVPLESPPDKLFRHLACFVGREFPTNPHGRSVFAKSGAAGLTNRFAVPAEYRPEFSAYLLSKCSKNAGKISDLPNSGRRGPAKKEIPSSNRLAAVVSIPADSGSQPSFRILRNSEVAMCRLSSNSARQNRTDTFESLLTPQLHLPIYLGRKRLIATLPSAPARKTVPVKRSTSNA